MKDMDAHAISVVGIPSDTLMRRAAKGAAEQAEKMLKPGEKTVIFCGSGNNGGDGIAMGCYLKEAGYPVSCIMVGTREKMTPDSQKMLQWLQSLGEELEDYDASCDYFSGTGLIVDALFGTGLSRNISGKYEGLIEKINESRVPVLACDISSGISADTGNILGRAVKADVTVTFNLPKTGQLLPPGTEYTGKLLVHDIGIPQVSKDTVEFDGELVTEDMVLSWLPGPKLESHKGDFGKLLMLCGSRGYTGAAALAAKGPCEPERVLYILGCRRQYIPFWRPSWMSRWCSRCPVMATVGLAEWQWRIFWSSFRIRTLCWWGPVWEDAMIQKLW